MSEDAMKQIEDKLDLLTRLVASQLIEKEKNLEDKAYLLDRLGVDRKEVARICDTNTDSIKTLIHKKKKAKGGRKNG